MRSLSIPASHLLKLLQAKLENEMEELQAKSAALREEAQKTSAGTLETGDVLMDSIGPAPVETSA